MCGEPAEENIKPEVFHPFGDPYDGVGLAFLGAEKVQCKIRAYVVFSFVEHRTGFGGPPDLCKICAAKLCKELTDNITAI